MHYKDGTEVKLGDLARTVHNEQGAKTCPQTETIGIVVGGTPGASGCNLQLSLLARRTVSPLGASSWEPARADWPQSATASECLRIDTPIATVEVPQAA